MILSAFSIGYAFAFLGGPVVNWFGGAKVFGIGSALTAVLAILTPFLLHIHLYVFIFGRVLQGLFEVRLCLIYVVVLEHLSFYVLTYVYLLMVAVFDLDNEFYLNSISQKIGFSTLCCSRCFCSVVTQERANTINIIC